MVLKKLTTAGLKPNTVQVIELPRTEPFQGSSPFEKLIADLSGASSCRINIQHRLVYQALEEDRIVKLIRMWTHIESPARNLLSNCETFHMTLFVPRLMLVLQVG